MTFTELLAQYKTKRAIADATGYSYRTVWGWEKAGKIPAKAAENIAVAMNMTASQNAPTPNAGSPTPSNEGVAGVAATEPRGFDGWRKAIEELTYPEDGAATGEQA